MVQGSLRPGQHVMHLFTSRSVGLSILVEFFSQSFYKISWKQSSSCQYITLFAAEIKYIEFSIFNHTIYSISDFLLVQTRNGHFIPFCLK